MPTSKPMIVDSHVHVWPFGLVHSGQRVQQPMHATPADLLATADGSGVDVIVMTPASVFPDNGYALGAAGTVPSRLRAAVGMDPRWPDALPRLRAYAAAGAVGVRIVPGALPLEGPDDMAALTALADVAVELGLVIQWTAGLPLTGGIDHVAARHPAAVQVLDHLGLPPDVTDLSGLVRIRQLAAIPGLTIKLSGMYALSRAGFPFRDTWDWAKGVLDAFGPDRMMWASDWPLSGELASHAQLRAMVDDLPFLDAASRLAILSTTACRVWSIPATRDPAP
jgi:predicted TIM-barrel fold metal-dependent hydrolase